MDERLPAHLEAAGLRRMAESQGGHGTILHKGDADRGSLILIVAERGAHRSCLERSLGPRGYAWNIVGPKAESAPAEIGEFIARRRRADPDSWLIELDIPRAERFIAEILASG